MVDIYDRIRKLRIDDLMSNIKKQLRTKSQISVELQKDRTNTTLKRLQKELKNNILFNFEELERIRNSKKHNHHISMDKTIGTNHFDNLKEAQMISSEDKKYAQIWLLNAKNINRNGWGVSPTTLDYNIHKFIGRPFVVTAQEFLEKNSPYGNQYVHPSIPTENINTYLKYQEQFKIGTIVDIIKKDQDYYAQIEILPKYQDKSLPPFCSPSIYKSNLFEDDTNITSWEAMHLAGLTEKPAYGARLAILKGTCIGTKNECNTQFKNAKSLTTCDKKVLQIEKLKTKLKLSQ